MKLKVPAKLDPKFAPLSVVCRDMREATKLNGQDIIIGVERNNGYTTTYKARTSEKLPTKSGEMVKNIKF